MKFPRYLLPMVCVLLVITGRAQNPTTPDGITATLKETLDWIKKNTPLSYELKFSGGGLLASQIDNVKLEFVEFDNCTIKWRSETEIFLSGKFATKSVYEVTVKLGDLDPVTLEVFKQPGAEMFNVRAHTYEKKQSIQTKLSFYNPAGISTFKEETKESDTNFPRLSDRETANRSSRAYKHAIYLCGGKVEPF